MAQAVDAPSSLPAPRDEEPQFSHKQILEIVWALLLCLFVSSLSATVVATALPTIVGELGGQSQLAWVASATLLTMTVSTPLWGKVSDLYGRKPLMQVAIAVFVVASILAGLSQSMGELVASRALQGIGAGGVQALAQATMADIVTPRERGRYSGYLGASFGLATVAGPLIGGFLVDGPGWRWCFYVGLPIAGVASVVLHRKLHLPRRHQVARIDWLGGFFLSLAASSVLVVLSLAGTAFPWGSVWTYLLGAVSAVSLVVAIAVERRAAEPILPPRLFRGRTFRLVGLASFFVGFAMFGAMIYLPQYLQVVKGLSPTASGMLTLPLVGSMLTASIASGKAITRWGRWKIFPIVGLVLMTIGASMFSTLRLETPLPLLAAFMAVFGLGLGLTMQVLVLAIQNTCDRRDLGIATSTASFFRSMGGSVGVALFGAILTARMTAVVPGLLARHGVRLPAHGSAGDQLGTPAQIAALSEPLRSALRQGFAMGLDRVYLVAVPLVVLSLVLIIAVKEIPLRGRARVDEPRQVAATKS